MSSSSEDPFESMLSMLASSGGPTASSSPPVNSLLVNPVMKFQVDWLGCAFGTKAESFPSLRSRCSGWSRVPWSCSGSGLESWVVVAHGRLVLVIVESDRKEEEEDVCFSESWWGRNLAPAWVPVVLAGLEVLVEPVVDCLGLHSGILVGDPVRMTQLSHCENSFQIFLS